jgi:hypothetical protein
MGDSTTETLKLQCRRKNEAYAREQLLGENNYLDLAGDSISWILFHIDCFVSQSRGNNSVNHVFLRPHAFNGCNYDDWDKVGQALGNMQALERLRISSRHDYDDDEDFSEDEDEDEDPPIPDWEILARILRHVRQSVNVIFNGKGIRTVEEVQPFARAIRGHPTITSIQDRGMFPYESLDTLFSTLTTLPALESVTLGAPEVRQSTIECSRRKCNQSSA